MSSTVKGSGTGYSMTITETNDNPSHGDYGYVSKVVTNSGGSGYVAGDKIGYLMGYSNNQFVLFVDSVDGSGAVTRICWKANECNPATR
jgi:hypothetical protein